MSDISHQKPPEVLIDLLRRAPLLEVLSEGEFDRRELEDRLDVSRATVHRHTRLLRELDVVERVGGTFGLTEAGELLTDAITRFDREARAALQLAPVLDAIEDAPVLVDSDAFAGARVTSAEHGDSYSPVARFVSLVHETRTLRGFDVDLIVPVYMEEIQRRIVDGMETETIVLPTVVREMLEWYPEKCAEACASGHLTVRLHDDLPFGLVVFDDRVGVGVGERDTRQLRAFADTDSTAAREWAERVYECYEEEAVLLEEFTEECFYETVAAAGHGL